jgi:hypothetical protein
MNLSKLLACATLVLSAAGNAHAATVNITDNAWHEFDVDSLIAQTSGTEWIDNTNGNALSFTFTLSNDAYLRVVDAGFAGDTFNFVLNSSHYSTSSVAQTEFNNSPIDALVDFNFAWADSTNFSRSQLLLSAGTYTLTGSLKQSVLLGSSPSLSGSPLNATVGGVQIAAVPEANAYAMLLAGLGLIGFVSRRRMH